MEQKYRGQEYPPIGMNIGASRDIVDQKQQEKRNWTAKEISCDRTVEMGMTRRGK